jgi:hypothetical protein
MSSGSNWSPLVGWRFLATSSIMQDRCHPLLEPSCRRWQMPNANRRKMGGTHVNAELGAVERPHAPNCAAHGRADDCTRVALHARSAISSSSRLPRTLSASSAFHPSQPSRQTLPGSTSPRRSFTLSNFPVNWSH